MSPKAVEQFHQPEEQFSREAFVSQWGETLDIPAKTLSVMWNESEWLMPDYPYHNFVHVRKTLFAAMDICDTLEAETSDYTYNRRVLVAAILFHDSKYDEDPLAAGFESKEAHSAYIFGALAPRHGFSDDEISLGQRLIMATKLGELRNSPEEEVIVKADIYNTSQTYEDEFKQNFDNFAEETRQLCKAKGVAFSMNDFAAKSIEILCTYVHEMAGDDPFRMNVVANLRGLAREQALDQGVSIVRFIQKLNSTIVQNVLGYRLPLSRKKD